MQLDKFKILGKAAVVTAAILIGGLTMSADASAQVSQRDSFQHTAIHNVGSGNINVGNVGKVGGIQIVNKQVASPSAVSANINLMRAKAYGNSNNHSNTARMEGSNYVGNETGIEGVDFNRPKFRR